MQDARCLKVKPRERAFKQFKSPVLNVLTTFSYMPDDYVRRLFEIYHQENGMFRCIFSLVFMFCRQQRIASHFMASQEALSLFHRGRQLLPSHNFYRTLRNKTQQHTSNKLTNRPQTLSTQCRIQNAIFPRQSIGQTGVEGKTVTQLSYDVYQVAFLITLIPRMSRGLFSNTPPPTPTPAKRESLVLQMFQYFIIIIIISNQLMHILLKTH